MMKTLYLVRHAKSSWEFPHLSDYERPLNNRGKRDAPIMGRRLRVRGITPGCFVSSPALRARETSLLVSREIGFPESEIVFMEQIYAAEVPDLLEVIASFPQEASSAFLVGHNPGMTSMAEYLTESHVGSLPTSGIACIEFSPEVAGWAHAGRGLGRLAFLDYPKRQRLS